ncbi:DegT/DnrJ/EryC1/StrS family aminotransferase [Paenibacillus lutimineralis]|uniref:DegT/DnrJ/EryC1/StrS family aminotransferase n=1 Tax=Paenibacillus lutimineralis TaxID=2707005 RepID=A0A3Q9IAH2_9BACL|nr:DegT/DnrJ/EryC1/StrS family aminotransferase [Paenibacillus lutimineralis]AZS16352.1 DegT/DnrJ/EryC1/StrS family aminotransferase [Paenibacillus lutimineralis]
MELALLGGKPIRSKPFAKWPIYSAEEVQKMKDVLSSLSWGGIKDGSEVWKFEQEFASFHGIEHAIAVCNGTCALMAAYTAVGIGPGDEVIVPSMSFISTATAATLLGAVPVFVDINPTDHCMRNDSISAAISPKTKAIVPVHIGGHPCDMDFIMDLAHRYNLKVIEDCAQALGAEWKGRKVGTFGDIGMFSFAETKNITSGEGGALITQDSGLANKIAELRNHGREFGMKYHHPSLGYNFRISEFHAGLLRVQLARLEEHLERKNKAGTYLAEAIDQLQLKWFKPLDWNVNMTKHGFFSFASRYIMEYFGDIPKGIFLKALLAEGIPVGHEDVAPFPIYENPIYSSEHNSKAYECRIQSCPNVQRAYREIVITGQSIHSSILLGEETDLDDYVKALSKINTHKRELQELSKQSGRILI